MFAELDALQVLREIAARRRYPSNQHYPHRAATHVMINLPIDLVRRMDEAIARADGLERPPVSG
jgi:predicted metalloenzyme YecM